MFFKTARMVMIVCAEDTDSVTATASAARYKCLLLESDFSEIIVCSMVRPVNEPIWNAPHTPVFKINLDSLDVLGVSTAAIGVLCRSTWMVRRPRRSNKLFREW
jgi:hypothetical protein